MRKKRNYSYAMKSAETHRTQLYCLPGNSYIIPETVILLSINCYINLACNYMHNNKVGKLASR